MNMKKIIYSLMVCCGLVTLASCEKKVTTEDPSTVTYYVSFEMNGDETMLVPLNTTFKDPGVVATENGVDVNDKVVVNITDAAGEEVSSIPTNAPGLFYVEYSAVNNDGFGASVERTVIVYDPSLTASIAGTYIADMSKSLYGLAGKTFADYAPNYSYTGTPVVHFSEIAPGFFQCDDLLGGWYAQLRGIGTRANMGGIVALNADNTLTLLSSYIPYWGDALDYLDDSSYDPETGILTYFVSYAGQIYITPYLIKQ